MTEITLPNHWQPRDYQLPAWRYLERGGRLAYLVWHRRAGKDDMALHWAAVAAHERVGNYWHILPQASQARKAVWEAVNPHTGRRRIDEAFPLELRQTTRENEMLIRFKSGSTWQVIGSDNYDSLVGSPPIGVVFSEWALARPQSWAYLRPILAENGGWAAFITTPRGNNHARRMFDALKSDQGAYVEKLTAEQTNVFSLEQLAKECRAYISEYGQSVGEALFAQEYLCSFAAAVYGAIYAKELDRAEDAGRVIQAPYDPHHLVSTAWDIGWGDSTSIWFYQVIGGEIRFIDFHEDRNEPITTYLERLRAKDYRYDTCHLPHDADNGQLATGKSIAEIVHANGFRVRIAPKLPLADGISAARLLLAHCVFDADHCRAGLDSLRNYTWDTNQRLDELKATPLHNWASHGADAFRYAAVSMQSERPKVAPIRYAEVGIV